MAVASEHVVADVVEVEALPELVHEYKVTSVPKTLVNGSIELVGAPEWVKSVWIGIDPSYLATFFEGLHEAGLDIPDEPVAAK